MNTNDLPLAQKLAALMEAGRAANPHRSHIRGQLEGRGGVCAMGYALLGAGLSMDSNIPALAQALGVEDGPELRDLVRRVITTNDHTRASMDEIIEGVRDGTLRKAALSLSPYMMSFADIVKAYPTPVEFSQAWIDDWAPAKPYYTIGVDLAGNVKSEKVGPGKPRKADVRVSAKTGASWPKPKHAFA